MTNSVLELTDVSRRYDGSPPVEALSGVSLNVDRGELLAIVGPSGSGKSTLLNIIGTLDRATDGSVVIEETPIAELSDSKLAGFRAARLGFVFQQFHLLEAINAVDNVALGLLYQGLKASQRRMRAAEALERVGLSHRLAHKPSQLSGGERQRVAIARAIVGEPALVLADEPTGNLDSVASAAIASLLCELNTSGTTIIVITHDEELAAMMRRRVALHDGRLTEHQRPVESIFGVPDTSATGALR
ncbi:MAG: ABC transporter ATP-binding protein [Actinomycetia bacterium]|nr:ABC transporter ATP-binding protein [Actinomycetes bacterium]